MKTNSLIKKFYIEIDVNALTVNQIFYKRFTSVNVAQYVITGLTRNEVLFKASDRGKPRYATEIHLAKYLFELEVEAGDIIL